LLAVLPLFVAAPLAAQTAKRPILVQAAQMQPMTFTMLLVNLQKEFEVAIAPDKFTLSVLETLRKAGYNVVGAENVLFAVDKSSEARLLLGGTIIDVTRHRNLPGNVDLCDVAVRWELFDKVAEQVVYKRLTRFRIIVGKNKPVTEIDLNRLVTGALASLLASPRFVDAAKLTPGTEIAASAPASYRPCSAVPRSLPTDIDAVIAASASIPAGGGAGVFVSPDGVLLTAAHVVAGLDEVAVKLRDGRSLPGRVVRRDPERDVAIVRVAGAPESCVAIAAAWPAIGDELFAIGAPTGEELAFSVSRGIASGAPIVEGRKLIQTDASISPGNSGGPLLDAKGRLVGIVAAKRVGVAVEGIAFAVHADTALAWLGLSAGAATTLTAAGAGAAARIAAVEDDPDPPLLGPYTAVTEWNEKQHEIEDARRREERPARVARGFGALLILGGVSSFFVGTMLLTIGPDDQRNPAIASMAIGGAAIAGAIALFVASAVFEARLSDNDATDLKEVALGVAPLGDGRGFALSLGGRF
jgi:S1-C subfamily serine protease